MKTIIVRLIIVSILFSLSISSNLLACECIQLSFESNYQSSDFIAIAKILSVSEGEDNSDYQKVEIGIIHLYKGKYTTTLLEASVKKYSCATYTPPNTIWLIYAKYNVDGIAVIGECSASFQIKNIGYDPQFPNYKKNMDANIQNTKDALAFLKKKKLNSINEFGLKIDMSNACLRNLNAIDFNTNSFAVFEVSVAKNLEIKKVKYRKAFDNKEFSKKILTCFKNTITVHKQIDQELPYKSKVVIVYFYYLSEETSSGFLSKYIL